MASLTRSIRAQSWRLASRPRSMPPSLRQSAACSACNKVVCLSDNSSLALYQRFQNSRYFAELVNLHISGREIVWFRGLGKLVGIRTAQPDGMPAERLCRQHIVLVVIANHHRFLGQHICSIKRELKNLRLRLADADFIGDNHGLRLEEVEQV